MGMNYDEYIARTNLLQTSIDRRDKVNEQRVLDKVQAANLNYLASDPAWNVYTEKLTELKERYTAVASDLERRMVDMYKPLSPDDYQKLQPQLAFARGYISAIETAFELVLQSQTKKETKDERTNR